MKWFLLLSCSFSLIFMLTANDSFSLGSPLLKVGSRGDQVTEAQSRLAYLGYYQGSLDGQYGWQTYQSVKTFQSQFGLEQVDGIIGSKTGNMLRRATSEWYAGINQGAAGSIGSSNRFSENDINLMARAVYGEARGEPYEGQVAVAAVILNRLQSEEFPNSISGVIFEDLAFTAVADGQIWLEPNDTAYRAVDDAINGWDPSSNALYYFNPVTATSKWIWTRPQIKQIGRHIFCR